jgi:hypothetical protein
MTASRRGFFLPEPVEDERQEGGLDSETPVFNLQLEVAIGLHPERRETVSLGPENFTALDSRFQST